MSKSQIIYSIGIPLVLVVIVVALIVRQIPYWRTEKQLKVALQQVMSDKADGPARLQIKDGWDEAIYYERKDDPKGILYIVCSAGPDKQLDTADDMPLKGIDLNKSRIVGEWIGKRTKQAAEGFVDGFTGEQDFPEPEPEPVKESGKSWLGKMKDKWNGE